MANQASAASSSSALSCPASTSYPHYDVFINHRGPDVKNTLAAHLYRRLLDKGLRVFLDKPEMLPGHPITPQILAAIEVASVHIAIFSPGYAQSTWCLDELELMLKTTNRVTNRATILPVFYNVKPSDLRYTTKGAYAEALLKHEKNARYDSSTIQNWRNALSYAAEISGFELDGDEEELLRNVVKGVLKNVSKPPLYVAKYPTGLEEKLQDFEMRTLNEHEGGRTRAKVVGIVGFGGVGKTTLAKEFFNRNRSHYNESSFLSDVRERSIGSLNYLQTQLIKDLKHQNIEIDNPDEGVEILKRDLSSCHALIILDDVDKASQLEMLLPVDVLSAESLILVTSRDKHVLEESRVFPVYNMTGLNTSHSKELFCSYSLHQSLPPTEFAELVDRFVKGCNGLPLSLKVIGALLCGENKEYWEEQLDRLGKTLPEEIQERLKISYYSLGKQDQPIFLDIACFFLGNKDRAVRIWGLVAIRNLENKCLLDVDSNNNIRMHDHIRDCARSIAEEESMPRRLWYQTPTNVMDALSLISSSVEIEFRGISTMVNTYIINNNYKFYIPGRNLVSSSAGAEREQLLNNSNFCRMKNLFFVATTGNFLEAILRRAQSPQLSWLQWYGSSCSSLPHWISMKKLRVLEVEGENMKSLWPQQYQGPLELRELRIRAPLSHLPKSIGQLQHLEWIDISLAVSNQPITLETLPEEFCHLRSLKYLVLNEFSNLISLPDSFGKLTNLEHINLTLASSLQRLPNSFGNLTRLKYLCLRGCYNLTISNGALANIARLEYLDLQFCEEVRELPPQVSHQRSLKELHLFGTNLKELPCGIGDLCNLETLVIGNESLELLPSSLGNLKSLKHFSLRESPKVKCLPDSFGMLTQLRHLQLFDRGIECLPDSFGMLNQLRELRLEEIGIEYLPQDLPKLNNLESLSVKLCPLREVSFLRGEGEAEISSLEGGSRWNKLDMANDKCMFGSLKELCLLGTNLKELPCGIGDLCNLERLKIGDESLEPLPSSLGNLKNLKHFSLEGSPKVKCLPDSFGMLTQLRELQLSHCGIEYLPQDLPKLNNLQTLTVRNCPLREVSFLRGEGEAEISEVAFSDRVCPNLQNVELHNCEKLEELKGLETLKSLEQLKVGRCRKLKSIPGLGQLTKLHWLVVRGCHEIEGLPGVEHCMLLEILETEDCPKLKSIPELGQLPKLQRLVVSGCNEIERLPAVEHCMSLKHLNVSKCPRLKKIQGLGQLTNLTVLNVSRCDEIEGIPGVEHLMLLEELEASKCHRLKRIQGLGKLTNLRTLDVNGCHEIEELPGVEHLMLLETLLVRDCPRLKSIPELAQLTNLTRLDVSGCHEIEESLGVEHCTSLKYLIARDCLKLWWGGEVLQQLPRPGLEQLTNLTYLCVSGCHEIEGLPGVEHCMSLQSLEASKCPRLKRIQGLGKLTNLRRLDVSGCDEIAELAGVEHCTFLKYLIATDCPKLRWGGGVLQQLRLRLKRDLRIDAIRQYKRQRK